MSASRVGSRVELKWTTPAKTSDGFLAAGQMTAVVCRVAGAKCLPVSRLQVRPGSSATEEILPVELQRDPVGVLSYRVEVLNGAGRSAGLSNEALTASGTAPEGISRLNARVTEKGVVLEWGRDGGLSNQVLVSRERQGEGKATKKQAAVTVAKEEAKNVWLRVDGSVAGMVDGTSKFGETYSYRAVRVRKVQIAGEELEIRSEESPAVMVSVKDVFPPRVPMGLVVVPVEGGVDLSWEPNTESDLAGYFVYRREEGAGAVKISEMVRVPGFRDAGAVSGKKYFYSLSAVDLSGNESRRSEEVLVSE